MYIKLYNYHILSNTGNVIKIKDINVKHENRVMKVCWKLVDNNQDIIVDEPVPCIIKYKVIYLLLTTYLY